MSTSRTELDGDRTLESNYAREGSGFLWKNSGCLMPDFCPILLVSERPLSTVARGKGVCLFILLFPTWLQSERHGLITNVILGQDNTEKSKVSNLKLSEGEVSRSVAHRQVKLSEVK